MSIAWPAINMTGYVFWFVISNPGFDALDSVFIYFVQKISVESVTAHLKYENESIRCLNEVNDINIDQEIYCLRCMPIYSIWSFVKFPI